jgi:hypothetical protein
MLKFENVLPLNLAYDRPSPKLIGFLSKHYGLSQYVTQNNNFVVFNEYFDGQRSNFKTKTKSNCNSVYNSEKVGNNINNPNPSNHSNLNSNRQSVTSNHLANLGQQLMSTNINSNILPNNNNLNYDMNAVGINSATNGILNNESNFNLKQENYSSSKATPSAVFANHYLHNPSTNYYDGIYSKKKLNLLNDYLSSPHLQPDEFVR